MCSSNVLIFRILWLSSWQYVYIYKISVYSIGEKIISKFAKSWTTPGRQEKTFSVCFFTREESGNGNFSVCPDLLPRWKRQANEVWPRNSRMLCNRVFRKGGWPPPHTFEWLLIVATTKRFEFKVDLIRAEFESQVEINVCRFASPLSDLARCNCCCFLTSQHCYAVFMPRIL